MASRESGSQVAVFFLNHQQVSRHMLFSEFEALLDGLGALPEYNDEDANAVYAVISKTGQIRALVFFKLYFDENGVADSSWNLPLERLADVSGSGPDLGGGPIRLACRSQCSINWHQEDLWDPDMSPGSNDFNAVKKAVQDNRLRFNFDKPEDDIPTLAVSPRADAKMAKDDLDDELESARRTKLARLLKEQRLRIRTLESYKGRVDDQGEREARILLHTAKNEAEEYKRIIAQLKLKNEKLAEKLSARNEQFIDLQDKVTGQAEIVGELEKKLKHAKVGDRDRLEKQKFEAEIVLLKEQLDRRDIDLAYRDEREDQLRSELEELKDRLAESDGDEAIIDRLRELEVVYVVYHPGAGHITMTSWEIKKYAANPIAFVASKCLVTEAHYRDWLAHFEKAVCKYVSPSGVACNCPVEKISTPSEFEPGVSDHCAKHGVLADG